MSRPSKLGEAFSDVQARNVIRLFAGFVVLIGIAIAGYEVIHTIVDSTTIHFANMLWALVFISLGLLVIQKGNVSESLEDLAETGTIVRSWWPLGRRAYDNKPVVPVEEKPSSEPKPPEVG